MNAPNNFPSIADARQWAKRNELTGIVIVAFNGEQFKIASYGSTKSRCAVLASFVDQFGELLEADDQKLAMLGGRP